MWTNLINNPPLATLVAALLALAACFWLSRAAYVLPRTIDPDIPLQVPAWHFRIRKLFMALGPLIAALFCWFFGSSVAALASIGFMLVLLSLAWIDAETSLLPDRLTLSLLWAGLLVNLNNTFVPLEHAVLGAAIGYLFLWLLYQIFLRLTQSEGMGFGDFKLVAALGAWLGWMSLPILLVFATALSLVVVLVQRLRGKHKTGNLIRFGPYLALAGIIGMLGRWL